MSILVNMASARCTAGNGTPQMTLRRAGALGIPLAPGQRRLTDADALKNYNLNHRTRLTRMKQPAAQHFCRLYASAGRVRQRKSIRFYFSLQINYPSHTAYHTSKKQLTTLSLQVYGRLLASASTQNSSSATGDAQDPTIVRIP